MSQKLTPGGRTLEVNKVQWSVAPSLLQQKDATQYHWCLSHFRFSPPKLMLSEKEHLHVNPEDHSSSRVNCVCHTLDHLFTASEGSRPNDTALLYATRVAKTCTYMQVRVNMMVTSNGDLVAALVFRVCYVCSCTTPASEWRRKHSLCHCENDLDAAHLKSPVTMHTILSPLCNIVIGTGSTAYQVAHRTRPSTSIGTCNPTNDCARIHIWGHVTSTTT